jgi:acyl-CoA synthetase (AMP-forming)/AMP-acid ligase II
VSSRADSLSVARTLVRSGFLAPLRPDKYVRIGRALKAQGLSATSGLVMASRRDPSAVGLVDERGALTWAQIDARADALAVALSRLSKGRPTTVALLCRNHRGFVDGLVAAGKMGADLLLLNTGFSGPQLSGVLEREGADVLIVDEEFLPLTRHLQSAPELIVAWQDVQGTHPTLDGLIAAYLGEVPKPASRTGRVLLLTSGTTGTPKGARRGNGGSVSDLATVLERVPWRAGGVTVCAAPMFHAWGFGIFILSSTMTSTVVMRRFFDPETTLQMVAQHRANALAVVPVMLERISALPTSVLDRYDLSSLELVTASGSAMNPSAVLRFMDQFGDVVYNNYNATEAGMITIASPADLRAAPTTAGRPVRDCEVRVLDTAGSPVPVGEVGRLFVRNTTQFEGYSDGATKDFLEGFMATGDVGRLDASGRLFVEGRDDEMIVSGGENVYPREVELSLAEHPAVAEVAVVGVPDEEFGQRLEAFVTLAEGASATEAELKAHVRDQLARYKVPRRLTVLKELPRTTTGKILKRELPISGTVRTALRSPDPA